MEKIDQMQAGGGTCIGLGLDKGLQVVRIQRIVKGIDNLQFMLIIFKNTFTKILCTCH